MRPLKGVSAGRIESFPAADAPFFSRGHESIHPILNLEWDKRVSRAAKKWAFFCMKMFLTC